MGKTKTRGAVKKFLNLVGQRTWGAWLVLGISVCFPVKVGGQVRLVVGQ